MLSDAAKRMDRMYRFQRHIYDVTRRPYLLGRTTLINGLCPPETGTILEVGCGTAWNLLRVAQTYPDTRLFGFDVSSVMLATANKRISAARLHGRIRTAEGDASTFEGKQLFGLAAFDRIFLSYTLSMIPVWTKVLPRALDHLSSNGQLHIVDFGDAKRLPGPARVGLHAWLAQFDVTPRVALRQELDRLCAERGLTLFHTDLHRGYAQYAVVKSG